MPRRTRIDVIHSKKDGNWVVQGGGEQHKFDRKIDAVRSAAAAGKMLGNSQVVIRAMDGRIQSERTYGNDPRRSKG